MTALGTGQAGIGAVMLGAAATAGVARAAGMTGFGADGGQRPASWLSVRVLITGAAATITTVIGTAAIGATADKRRRTKN